MSEHLETLDRLIQKLEAALTKPETPSFFIEPGQPPRSATMTVIGGAYVGLKDRKPRPAEVHRLDHETMLVRSVADLTKNMPVEVEILMNKNALGETLHQVKGKVLRAQRISGGYELEIAVEDQRGRTVSVSEHFHACVEAGDAAQWNRWCADLDEGVDLRGLDLAHQVLSHFDLCCADLSGSDFRDSNLSHAMLAGANLSDCKLDGVQIAGADLFRATLPREHMDLLVASGMPEVESVVLQ